MEAGCRRVGVEVWSSGAPEACCRCRDVEEFASRSLEIRRRRVDIPAPQLLQLSSSYASPSLPT